MQMRSADFPGMVACVAAEELARRPSRPPDYAAENRALVALARTLATNPGELLQRLSETALELCRAHSAGFSLLTDDGQRFRWAAVTGEWARHAGGGTPRDFGPCGMVLDRNAPMLFSHPEGHFEYLAEATPPIDEGLLLPFYVGGKAVGTIWVISHRASRRFDAEDQRVMTSLAAFASAAYQAQRQSEDRLRLALEAGKMGPWEWHIPEGRVVWSEALQEIHGLVPGTFEGTLEAYQRDIHPEDRERVFASVAKLFERGEDHQVEYRIVRPDGSVRWVEGRGRLTRDGAGRPLRLIGVCADITEKKRAEQALRDSEERLRAIIETTPECVKTVAADGSLLQMNAAGLAMIGAAEPGQVLGRSIYDVIAPEDRERFREFNEAVCRGRDGMLEFDVVALDGRRCHMQTHAVPLARPDGTLAQLAITRDVTEQRRAQEALREADRRKDEFIATLSHELRNPLAPLRNGLQLLQFTARGDARMEPLLDLMERQLNHLVRLVDDLLEMSRISRGVFELRRQPVRIADVVRNALETTEALIREARHELDVSLPDEPLWVDGDPVRLAQILANLLNNAAKYTPHGGRIGVAATRIGGRVELKVRDNGAGISAEALPALFDMFTRGGGVDRGGQGGLGIGLALSRRLAEMHGGTVRAASDGPGRGAEFVVSLPLSAAPERAEPAAGAAIAHVAPHRILLVDDNRDAAQSLSMVLRILGAEVRVAYDGDEALQACESYQPGVVLLDIGMPGMDGYEVARRIRGRRAGRAPAIVALTGWGQEADRRRAREAGFDHHLVKPADLHTLQALLASLDTALPSH
jgi:two-component system CheB/CheR fusion protein